MRGVLVQRGKTWSVVLSTKDDNGKWKQKWISTGIKSKKYAEKVLNEIMCKVNIGDHTAPSRPAPGDYIEQ